MKFDSLINSIIENKCNYQNWFDLADIIYCQFISNIDFFDDDKLKKTQKIIIESQDENGFFHPPKGKKSHNCYHSTAYALSTLNLIECMGAQKKSIAKLINHVVKSIDVEASKKSSFGLVDKVHVWRASHTFGGMSCIFELGKQFGVLSSNPVLSYYESIIGDDGLWRFSNPILQKIFDSIYRIKHDPLLAIYGGAAHLYWHMSKIPDNVDPHITMQNLLQIYKNKSILEKVPYCLDYDLLFIMRFYAKNFEYSEIIKKEIDDTFTRVGLEILSFLTHQSDRLWLHALPGLLAALQVCSYSKKFDAHLKELRINLSDPMEVTKWL